ncbi:hypothetical protein J7L01_05000 [bacterium]|nr:hypothetical protein [bacterium]
MRYFKKLAIQLVVLSMVAAIGLSVNSALAEPCGCNNNSDLLAQATAQSAASRGGEKKISPVKAGALSEEEYKKWKAMQSQQIDTTDAEQLPLGRISDAKSELWQGEGRFAKYNPADEDLTKRNANTKTFRTPEGTLEAVISQGPVHYRDSTGAWQDISTMLEDDGNYATSSENIFQTALSKSNDEYYSISKDKWNIELGYFRSFGFENSAGEMVESSDIPASRGRLEGGKLVFDTFDSGREIVELSRIGVEHHILFESMPDEWRDAPSDVKYLAIEQELILPVGLTAAIEEEPSLMVGEILRIRDDERNIIFEFPLPRIHEINSRIIPHPDDTIKGPHNEIRVEQIYGKYRLTEIGGRYILTTLVPFDWLTSEDRAYPIDIDPTIICACRSSAWDTGWVDDYGGNCYTGYSYQGDVIWNFGNDYRKGWMFFNTSGIPDDAYSINSIQWHAYCFALNWPYWKLRDMSTYGYNCSSYYSYCQSGTEFLYQPWSSSEPTGWKSYALSSSANTRLKALLTSNWFGTGCDETDGSTDYYVDWYGYYNTSYDPYLQVNYTPLCESCPPLDYYGTYYPGTSWTTRSGNTKAAYGCEWYRYYLYANYQYIFTFCQGGGSASWDTKLYLYNSSCSQVAYNDDACGLQSEITYCPSASGYYWLKVCGWSSAYGSYTLAYNGMSAFGGPTSAYVNGASSATICSGQSVTLSASGGYGGEYYWAYADASGEHGGTCGVHIGDGSPVTWYPPNTTPSYTPGYFNVYVERRGTFCGTDAGSVTYRHVTVYFYNHSTAAGTWVGQYSSNWNDCENWGRGQVPSGIAVTIPNGSPNDPIISSAVPNITGLTIQSGGHLTIQSGGSLTNTGTVTVSSGGQISMTGGTWNVPSANVYGTFTQSGGTINISGIWYWRDGCPVSGLSGGTMNVSGSAFGTCCGSSPGPSVSSSSGHTININYSGSFTWWNRPAGTSSTSWGNVHVINGNVTVQNTMPFDVNGNFTLDSGTSWSLSSNQDMLIAKNWSNSGTFTCGSGTVTFDGSGTNYIQGGATTTFYNVKVVSGKTIEVNSAISASGFDCRIYHLDASPGGKLRPGAGNARIEFYNTDTGL